MSTGNATRNGYLASADGVQGPHSAAIDALFAGFDRPGHAGANVLVLKDGVAVHRRGYGVANIEDDVPFCATTVSHLGSTTKHFCSTALLILEDRGRLSLSDSIRKFVPELPAFAAPITLRHLLGMASGLPDCLVFPLFIGLDDSADLTRAIHLDVLSRLTAPMFAPGAGMTYSNSNYLLITMVVERVTSDTLAEFLRHEVFAPLGMDATSLVDDVATAVPFKASGYAPDAKGSVKRAPFDVELCGDGGIVSTLDDMARWLLHYRSGGLLARNFRARLEEPIPLSDGTVIPYRLGIMATEARGRRRVTHGGGLPGYLCDFSYFPDGDLGVVILTNLMDVSLLEQTDAIADIVLGVRPAAEICDIPAGFYVNRDRGYVVEIRIVDGARVCYALGEKITLHKTQVGCFESAKPSVYLSVRATEGSALEIRCGTVEPLLFEPEQANTPDLADYAGAYENPLLGETHHVFIDAGTLRVRRTSRLRPLVWDVLKPRGGDVFSAIISGEPSETGMGIVFRRDTAGRIAALEYSTARVRGLRFERVPAS